MTIRNYKKGHIVYQQQPIPQLLSSSAEQSIILTTEVEKNVVMRWEQNK
jgi:hypothetical protein